ncbi:MAG: DUF4350 domain-containing protein [Theionarchaea archaeon]|nr:DUF4350 domain-containing protein [Theionarchaea archaeon]
MRWQGPLIVIFLIVVVIGMVSLGENYTPEPSPRSSRNSEYSGTLAFYLLMETYTAVERLERSPQNLEEGTYLMIEPVRLPTEEEMEYIFGWVREGNRLIIFNPAKELMKYFDLELSTCPQKFASAVPHSPHWSSQHVDSLDLSYTHYFNCDQDPADITILFSDEGNPLVIEIPRGSGEIFLLSTSSLLSNNHIDSEDNEIFLVQLALSEKVYFDEYHLYPVIEKKGISWDSISRLFSSLYSLFFIQITLTIALFFIAYGKRFGTPRPAVPREIQSSELVESAATLYSRAGKREILKILEKDEKNSPLPYQKR